MFAFKRRKVTAQVLCHVKPMFQMIEIQMGRLPQGMCSDPYVIGFFMTTVALFITVVSKALGSDDARMVMLYVAADIFGADGEPMFDRVAALSSEHNSELDRGVKNAAKLVAFVFGTDDLCNDPDVLRARVEMQARGSSLDFAVPDTSEASKIAAILQRQLLTDYVVNTYGDEHPA